MDDHITLPDDKPAALSFVASYLRETRRDGTRAVWEHGDGREHDLRGYWQTPEYLDGLEDIARECERIVKAHADNRKARELFEHRLLIGAGVAVLLFIVVGTLYYALR